MKSFLEDVNAGILPLLEELNSRPLSEKSGTRRELYEQDERPVMHALPDIPYELGMLEKILKVRKDYQVRVHNRRFSVPYTYAGKEVKEALQKYPEQSFAQKFSLCNRQKFSGRKIKEGF